MRTLADMTGMRPVCVCVCVCVLCVCVCVRERESMPRLGHVTGMRPEIQTPTSCRSHALVA